MHCLPLNAEKKTKGMGNNTNNSEKNNFPQNLLHNLNRQIQHETDHTQIKRNDKKLSTAFTYHSPKIRKITNLFKNTNIGISASCWSFTKNQYMMRSQQNVKKPSTGCYSLKPHIAASDLFLQQVCFRNFGLRLILYVSFFFLMPILHN